MTEEEKKEVDRLAYWMTYALKLSRIREILMRVKFLGIQEVEIEETTNTPTKIVKNYNETIGQKI